MKKLPKRWKSVRRRWPAVKKSWLQQAQLAQEQQELHRRKGLLDNGDPNFKNGKEKIYDRLPVTAKQMDLVVKVLEAAIVVVLAVALLDKYLF